MTAHEGIQGRAGARDAALRLLNRLTAASVVAGVAGLGVFGYASAATYAGTPGLTASASASPSSISPSSGAGIAVTGGS